MSLPASAHCALCGVTQATIDKHRQRYGRHGLVALPAAHVVAPLRVSGAGSFVGPQAAELAALLEDAKHQPGAMVHLCNTDSTANDRALLLLGQQAAAAAAQAAEQAGAPGARTRGAAAAAAAAAGAVGQLAAGPSQPPQSLLKRMVSKAAAALGVRLRSQQDKAAVVRAVAAAERALLAGRSLTELEPGAQGQAPQRGVGYWLRSNHAEEAIDVGAAAEGGAATPRVPGAGAGQVPGLGAMTDEMASLYPYGGSEAGR